MKTILLTTIFLAFCIAGGYAAPLCDRKMDTSSYKFSMEVYGKENTIYKSIIENLLRQKSAKYAEVVCQNATFSTESGFTQIERINANYSFSGRLVKAVPLTPDCGTIAWAIVQKFEVINTTFPDYKDKYVLIIQPCPEFLGKDYFKEGEIYDMSVATNSGVTFGYVIRNSYEKEALPIFWSRQIKKAN